jgi:hypothetical protein
VRRDAPDWELLRTTSQTTRQHIAVAPHPHVEHVREERSRLRIKVRDRMGQSITWHHTQPDPDQIAEALAAASHGPRMVLPFGAHYHTIDAMEHKTKPTPDDLLDLPNLVQTLTHRRQAHFVTAAGATLYWDHTETRVVLGVGHTQSHVPVAVLNEAEARTSPCHELLPPVTTVPVADGQHRLRSPLLCSPLMLAALLLPRWTAALSRHAEAMLNLPHQVRLVDDGSGAPTDLEGTRRREITLLEADGAARPVRTLTSASRPGELTGHGGFVGPEFENLTLFPNIVRGAPESTACHVVTQARPLAAVSGVVALTTLADARPPSTVIACLANPIALLRHGHWVRPIQRGSGPWRSPWLELPEPHRVLTVLHVERHW